MSRRHRGLSGHSLDTAVRALCPLIEERVASRNDREWQERDLRRELVSCILGSQVRYEMASASTENLRYAGLLEDRWWGAPQSKDFAIRVREVLSAERAHLPYGGRYRFPNSRAIQLARARDALAQNRLTERLTDVKNPKALRRALVRDIPGLGPKQASMFLRNIGQNYELAILDTHVLRFMDAQNLLPISDAKTSTLSGYEKTEDTMVEYAVALDYPVGYLDWAIWATMRAAQELGL